MVNNSTNIIKTNNQLKQLNNKKKTTYGVGNPGHCLEQAQICGWVKPVVCIFFFIVLFNIKYHMFKLDCCPQDFSYFTISLRNH